MFNITVDDRPNIGITLTSKAIIQSEVLPLAIKMTFVHFMAVVFASIIILVSALLGKKNFKRFTNIFLFSVPRTVL